MDKIKINISANSYQILIKDMELFDFYKNNVSINQNLFLNTLIANYYSNIEEEIIENESNIKKIIKNNTLLKDKDIDNITSLINDYIINKQFNDEYFDVAISLKPTKVSSDAFNNINYSLNNKGYSKYFRMLFSSYTSKPQYVRERIIFKDKTNLILESIEEKKAISIELDRGRITLYPYKLVNSKEEQFNYLVCVDESNIIHSLRLTYITGLVKTKISYNLNDDIIDKLDRLISLGAQYACDPDNVCEYKVLLTDDGVKKFRRIYLHRPKVLRCEGNVYYFKCSYTQMYHYFFRFGKDAYIISTNSLNARIRNEYKEALNHYYEEYNKLKN